MDVRFTSAFYKLILARPLDARDIANMDEDLARGLRWLLHNPISGVDLTFW